MYFNLKKTLSGIHNVKNKTKYQNKINLYIIISFHFSLQKTIIKKKSFKNEMTNEINFEPGYKMIFLQTLKTSIPKQETLDIQKNILIGTQ